MAEQQNFCPSCGRQVQPDARFCSNCGQVLGEAAPPNPPEENVIQTKNVDVPPLPEAQRPRDSAGKVIRDAAIGCGVILFIVVLVIIIAGLASGGGGSSNENVDNSQNGSGQSVESDESFTNENYGELVADPDAFNGARVDITGQLLGAPETSDGETYFQMFADPENLEQSTLVRYSDTDVDLQADDYVSLGGYVTGSFEGENAFGAALDAVGVEADSLRVISAAEAVDPTMSTVEVGQGLDYDSGLTVSLERIEFGERTTRVFLTISNNSQDSVTFFSFDSNIVQGSSQIDVDDSYLYELDEPQSEISPGVTTEGAVVFGPADPSQPLNVTFEFFSDDYTTELAPATFEVTP